MRHVITLLFIVITLQGFANIKLPALVGDHMVLQRNTILHVWGWADKNEKITVSFLNQEKQTRADKNGKWLVKLDAVQQGGPYTLTVTGKNIIELKDILVGDVWLCGGQSNMGWRMSWGIDNGEEEIRNASYPEIRLFAVKEVLSYQIKEDLETDKGWEICNSNTVRNFSAVAYFFGRSLYQKYNVPIGLLSSNWGGTPAEAWMSPEALRTVPAYKAASEELAQSTTPQLEKRFEKRLQEWARKNIEKDKGFAGMKWFEQGLDTKDWKAMQLPGLWENSVLPDYNGSVWLRKEIDISPENAGKDFTLLLGHPDDMDSTWFNGVKIGGKQGNSLREYSVAGSLLKAGKNVITMRIVDYGANGGIDGKPDEMRLQIGAVAIPLTGDWLYRSGDDGNYTAGWPPRSPDQNMSELSVLYNSMIAPLSSFKIKGVIFYQGEANVNRAEEYYPLFTALMKDWRSQWKYEFPFVFAQLSTYLPPPIQPEESKWAQLREAQLKALSTPLTAMAVTIDIGSRDVHPRNKLDVGRRLALAAQKIAYNEDVVYSGPLYQSMQTEGNKIRLTFTHLGAGLRAKDKYGYLKGFAIAGNDRKFAWAKAFVDGNTVVVYNDAIQNPVAVRYGWAANPEDVNLYNSENLPASPFRTDSWAVDR